MKVRGEEKIDDNLKNKNLEEQNYYSFFIDVGRENSDSKTAFCFSNLCGLPL